MSASQKYDVAVIGGGPAGMMAALSAARRGKSVVLLEKNAKLGKKLDITGGLYASRNSQATTSYFNPTRDFSPTLEIANEWLQWRRYTRSFVHRVVVTGGDYAQQGFATKPVFGVRYEQEWAADDRLTLRYGIGRGEHPYDGVQTTRNFAYFYLDWKF